MLVALVETPDSSAITLSSLSEEGLERGSEAHRRPHFECRQPQGIDLNLSYSRSGW